MSVKSSDLLEDWRKSWIGVPRYWRSTVLPDDHCWANGDFVSFSNWPELHAVYEAGGLEGMLLGWDATEEEQAANLGKWRPDSSIPTGLYTPALSGQFFRNWGPNVGNAGSWGQDAIRNITGTAGLFKSLSSNDTRFSGALTLLATTGGSNDSDGRGPAGLSFDASLVVPTGPQNVPQHVWQPVVLYLGRPA